VISGVKMKLGLKNKVAVIGGSSSGIGKTVAMMFAKEGCRVVICGRHADRLSAVRSEILEKHKVDVLSVCMDQTKKEDIKRLVKNTVTRLKRIDILFTNTGGPKSGNFFDFSEEDWNSAHELLLLYVVRVYNEVIPIMKEQGFGRIINNTSFTVKEPADALVLSNVYRTAVVSLAKTLSRELARFNITINNICPGFVDTDRLKELFGKTAEKEGISADEVYKRAISNMPINRLQKSDDIARLVAFLASESAETITGTTIQIDGGLIKGLF